MTIMAGLPALLALGWMVYALIRNPTLENVALLCLAFSVMVLVSISRAYTVRLQDRIIRLEMRLRLERLGRAAEFSRLSTPQVVALRFAADAELPGLIDSALTKNLPPAEIKKAVSDWQADLHRT